MTQIPQDDEAKQWQLEEALTEVTLPAGVMVRPWREEDALAIARLSAIEDWPTPSARPEETSAAWHNSWPALLALEHDEVIGFLRALTDGNVTMYIGELLVAPSYRGRGIARALLDVCHALYPRVRLDLLATDESISFYEVYGFRRRHIAMRKSYF